MVELVGAGVVIVILVAAACEKVVDARRKNDGKLKFDFWMSRYKQ